MGKTKEVWKDVVTPDDLDAHMSMIGQAEVNGRLVASFLDDELGKSCKIYVPGCGTGQIFDFINSKLIEEHEFLLSDIKPEFLDLVKIRLSGKTKFRTMVDDLENSTLNEKCDAALIVLVLEHIDWMKGLENILLSLPESLFIIIQVQAGLTGTPINTKRELRPSIKKFAELAKPELVTTDALKEWLEMRGFDLKKDTSVEVPDHKIMRGLTFKKERS